MKNTVLIYDTEELDEFIVSDYFSKKITVFDLIPDIGDYLAIYKLQDNDKLEKISFDLYKTTDYWDILLMLNDRNPLFEMPYETDAITTQAETLIDKYCNNIYVNHPMEITSLTRFTEKFMADFNSLNESYRYLYVIQPTRMGDFIKLLKDNNYI